MIATVAETDFANNGSSTRPSEVGLRAIPPMWSVPAQVFRDYHENITFGLNVEHWNDSCLRVQDPIVCFKASTVLSLGEKVTNTDRNLLDLRDRETHDPLAVLQRERDGKVRQKQSSMR